MQLFSTFRVSTESLIAWPSGSFSSLTSKSFGFRVSSSAPFLADNLKLETRNSKHQWLKQKKLWQKNREPQLALRNAHPARLTTTLSAAVGCQVKAANGLRTGTPPIPAT